MKELKPNRIIIIGTIILLLFIVWHVSAVPVITPPSVSTPGASLNADSQIVSAPDSSDIDMPAPLSDKGKWVLAGEWTVEIPPDGSPTEAKGTTKVAENKNAILGDAELSVADLNADSYVRKLTKSLTRTWYRGSWWYFTLNFSGSSWPWLITLRAPYPDLDLYVKKWNGYTYKTIKSATTSSSNENIYLNINTGSYRFHVQKYNSNYNYNYKAVVRLYSWSNYV